MRLLLIEAVSVAIAAVAALWGRRQLVKRLDAEKENKELEEQVDILAHEEAERGPDFERLRRQAASILPNCPLWLRVSGEGMNESLDLHCSMKQGHDGDCYDTEHNVWFNQIGLTGWGEK